MEKLRIKDSMLYFFRSDGWFVKFLAIVGLIFVPIIGWVAIMGYFLRIAKRWLDEEYEGLPDFSEFGSLIASGFFLLIVMILYSLPQFLFAFIPCLGNLLYTAYGIVLALIMPYIICTIATEGTISGNVFAFGEIVKFVQENIINLLIFYLVELGIGIVSAILFVPFIAGGAILISIGEGAKYIVPALISFAIAAIIFLIVGIWSSSVSYALSGNVFGIWQRKKSFVSKQPPIEEPTATNPIQ
ncbi:hypothetical protein DRQ29_03025 [bacterium]|nr:MAG: hypothetical protein DRQ29_03025 [bacterium]